MTVLLLASSNLLILGKASSCCFGTIALLGRCPEVMCGSVGAKGGQFHNISRLKPQPNHQQTNHESSIWKFSNAEARPVWTRYVDFWL